MMVHVNDFYIEAVKTGGVDVVMEDGCLLVRWSRRAHIPLSHSETESNQQREGDYTGAPLRNALEIPKPAPVVDRSRLEGEYMLRARSFKFP